MLTRIARGLQGLRGIAPSSSLDSILTFSVMSLDVLDTPATDEGCVVTLRTYVVCMWGVFTNVLTFSTSAAAGGGKSFVKRTSLCGVEASLACGCVLVRLKREASFLELILSASFMTHIEGTMNLALVALGCFSSAPS